MSSKWGSHKYWKTARLSFSRLGNCSTRRTMVQRPRSPKCLWALGRIKCGARAVLIGIVVIIVTLPCDSDDLVYMKAYVFPYIVQNGQVLSVACLPGILPKNVVYIYVLLLYLLLHVGLSIRICSREIIQFTKHMTVARKSFEYYVSTLFRPCPCTYAFRLYCDNELSN